MTFRLDLDADVSDAINSATTAPLNERILGQIAPSFDQDYYRFSLQAGVTYSISLSGAFGSDLGPYLYLYDEFGDLLAENDDYLFLDSVIDFTPDISANYFVAASGLGLSSGDYELHVYDPESLDTPDVADDYSSEQPLAIGEATSGQFERISDIDVFVVDLQAGIDYRLNAFSATNAFDDGIYASVVDSDGFIVAEGGQFYDSFWPIDFSPAEDGRYFVELTSPGLLSGYRVSIQEQPQAEFPDIGNDIFDATAISVGSTFTGAVGGFVDTNDVYRVSLVDGQSYDLQLESWAVGGGDYSGAVEILDSEGRELKYWFVDPYGFGTQVLTLNVVESGDYYIDILGRPDWQEDYRFSFDVASQNNTDDLQVIALPDDQSSFSSPTVIAVNQEIVADIGPYDIEADEDVYVFDVVGGELYDISLLPGNDQDSASPYVETYVAFYPSQEAAAPPIYEDGSFFEYFSILELDGYGVGSSQRIEDYMPHADGIMMIAVGGEFSEPGEYRLRVTSSQDSETGAGDDDGSGSNVLLYQLNSGDLTISNASYPTIDTIQFGDGIEQADLTFQRSWLVPNAIDIYVDDAVIQLVDFYGVDGGLNSPITMLQFGDTSAIDLTLPIDFETSSISSDGIWLNQLESQSDAIIANSSLPEVRSNVTAATENPAIGRINSEGDVDGFTFEILANEYYVFSATAIGTDPLRLPKIDEEIIGYYFDNRPDFLSYSENYQTAQFIVSNPSDLDAYFNISNEYDDTGDYQVTLVQAQQLEDGTDTVAGEIANAYSIAVGDAVIAGIQTSDDIDVYQIEAPSDGFFYITLTPIGDTPLGDHQVTTSVQFASGELVRTETEGRGFLGYSDFLHFGYHGEDIFLQVDNRFGSEATGDYLLSLTEVYDTDGDDQLSATPLALGERLFAVLDGPEDQDWFKLTLVEGQDYTIDLTRGGINSFSPDLMLYDDQGQVLLQSIYGDNEFLDFGENQLYFEATYSGDYYVAASDLYDVEQLEFSTRLFGEYFIEINEGRFYSGTEVGGVPDPFLPMLEGEFDVIAASDSDIVIDSNQGAQGKINTPDDVDEFNFESSPNKIYVVSATGIGFDPLSLPALSNSDSADILGRFNAPQTSQLIYASSDFDDFKATVSAVELATPYDTFEQQTGDYRVSVLEARDPQNYDSNGPYDGSILDLGTALVERIDGAGGKDYVFLGIPDGAFALVSITPVGDTPLANYQVAAQQPLFYRDDERDSYIVDYYQRESLVESHVADSSATSFFIAGGDLPIWPILEIMSQDDDESAAGDYVITILQVYDTAGDDQNSEASLAINQSIAGSLESGSDQDWFKVQLNEGESYQITLEGNLVEGFEMASADFAIHDANGNELATFSGGVETINQADWIAPTSGDYFIAVRDDIAADGNGIHGGSGFTLSIAESDAIVIDQQLIVSGFTIEEGQTGEFVVSRTGNVNNQLTVNLELEGAGDNPVSGADIDISIPQSLQLVFDPGVQALSVPIAALADLNDNELSESMRLRITSTDTDSKGQVTVVDGSAIGTIRGNDQIVMTGANTSVSEGDSGTASLVFELHREGDLASVTTVDYRLIGYGDNPAQTSDLGGTPLDGSVIFAEGQSSATVVVDVAGDLVAEADEALQLQLVSASNSDGGLVSIANAASIGTIINDDEAPVLQILNTSVVEGAAGEVSEMTFTINRTGGTQDAIDVSFSFTHDTTDQFDIEQQLPSSGTISFAAGETSKQVSVQILGDYSLEEDEQVQFSVTGAVSDLGNQVELINNGVAFGTIINDDEGTVISVEAIEDSILEGGGSLVSPRQAGTSGWRIRNQEGGDLQFVVTREGELNTTATVDYSLLESELIPRDYDGVSVTHFFNGWRYLNSNLNFFIEDYAVATEASLFTRHGRNDSDDGRQYVNFNHLFSLDSPIQLNEAAGLPDSFGESLDIPIWEFDTNQLGGDFDGVISGSWLLDLYGSLYAQLEGFSLGELAVDTDVSSGIEIPSYITAGDAFEIDVSRTNVRHIIESESLNFGGMGIYFDLASSGIGLADLEVDLPVLSPIALPDLLVPEFDFEEVPIIEFSPLENIEAELFDGVTFNFAWPSGESDKATLYNRLLDPIEHQVGSSLMSLDFSLLEAASELSYLTEFLDLFKVNAELAEFDFLGTEIEIELDVTFLELMASAGLEFVQSFSLTPVLSSWIEIGGQTTEVEGRDTAYFSSSEYDFGNLEGALHFDLGLELDVSYLLQPVASAGIEALSASLQLILDDIEDFNEDTANLEVLDRFSASVGPLLDTSLQIDLFDPIELFSIDDIVLDDLFDEVSFDFLIPVRQQAPAENSLLSGSVTFEPGETEKVITFSPERDEVPEAHQNIIFNIDGVTLSDFSAAMIDQASAEVMVLDDDGFVRISSVGRFARFRGDPHLSTLDGLNYDFHAVGEFVLVESVTGPDLNIQVRTAAVEGSDIASQITALATELGSDRIMINSAATSELLINGEAVSIPVSPGYLDLDGGRLLFDGESYTVQYDSGDVLNVALYEGFLDVAFGPGLDRSPNSFRGLLGNGDGEVSNDLMLVDGTIVEQPIDFDVLYGEYADSWRVTDGIDGNSLFYYQAGENSAFFTDLDFPRVAISIADFPIEAVNAAEALVDAAGITDIEARDQAIYDLLVSGDLEFIEAAIDKDIGAEEVLEVNDASANEATLAGVFALTPIVSEVDDAVIDLQYQLYRTGDSSDAMQFAISLSGDVSAEQFVSPPPEYVMLAAGEQSTIITLQLASDDSLNGDRDVTLSIAPIDGPENLLITSGIATTTVIDDDAPVLPSLSLAALSESLQEGSSGSTNAQFRLSLSDTAETAVKVTVAVIASAQQATATTEDFASQQPLLFDVVIEAGTLTHDFNIAVAGDDVREPDEAFVVRLVAVEGAAIDNAYATTEIINDDVNEAPVFDDIDLGALVENAALVTIDLLQDAVDPDGGDLFTADLTVTDAEDNPVAFSSIADTNTIQVDPAQFADQLDDGDSVEVSVVFNVIDDEGTIIERSATLLIEGVSGPFKFYRDDDNDGFGWTDTELSAYQQPDGYALFQGDNDDADNSVYPSAPELNDGKDNDQDGATDEDNAAPTAQDDGGVGYTTSESEALETTSVLNNDTDSNNDVLVINDYDLVSALGVSIEHLGDGVFRYNPANYFEALSQGQSTTDTFSYAIADGFGGENTALVTITIEGENDVPLVLPNAVFSVEENQTAVGLIEASDVDESDSLEFSLVAGGDSDLFAVDLTSGVISFKNAPDYEVPADANADNVYEFNVSVSDGVSAVQQQIMVSVSDQFEPLAPEFDDINLGSVSEASVPLTIDLLADAVDPDGGMLSFEQLEIVDGSGNDVVYQLLLDSSFVEINPNQFAAILDDNETLDINITLVVIDDEGTRATRQIKILVEGLNGPFSYYSDADMDGFGNVNNRIESYQAPEGYVSIAGDSDDSDATIYPDAPEINDGKDNDQDNLIDEDNLAPRVVDDSGIEFTTSENSQLVTGSVLLNDSDPDGDDVVVSQFDNQSESGAIIQYLGNGQFSYDPSDLFDALGLGQIASDTFNYHVSDGFGGTDEGQVVVTIVGENDDPFFNSPTQYNADENQTSVGTVKADDIDSEDVIGYAIEEGLDGQWFDIDEQTGAVTFKQAPDFESPDDNNADGIYELLVSATDGHSHAYQQIQVNLNDVEELPDPVVGEIIQGSSGNDNLLGSDGDDTLIGNGGAFDFFTGGKGDDVFVFAPLADFAREVATITDYSIGDSIDLGGRNVAFSYGVGGTLYLFLEGADYDTLIVNGVTSIDEISFI
ncbi:cadherin-like domain-containing protein [Neiella marina]|uniref:Cadherin-like domain-containing protein n=1 Tax=Neiella holothuriorum TaxID=2870530 RepID=A0ABS7EFE2_9GAMM|nr:Ig-like domain-containing protein [Neiella holothuriorum]MBW8190643.1 cadherin-like domain-containing protein [Neiella holothuriorum]